jgi:two-component system chemotaxis response regulator CheB
VVVAVAGGAARVGDGARASIRSGVSTGGPVALEQFLGALRGAVLPPIVVVQHIPAAFLPVLVARLGQVTGCPCEVAVDGAPLVPGVVTFAPADHHLRVVGTAGALRSVWSDEPPRRSHRPAVAVLFESCAELDLRGTAVVMTGMGRDGDEELLRLRQRGWATLGQDEATCAIYGMPRAAKALGAVERELPLAELGPWVVALGRPRCVVPTVARR